MSTHPAPPLDYSALNEDEIGALADAGDPIARAIVKVDAEDLITYINRATAAYEAQLERDAA